MAGDVLIGVDIGASSIRAGAFGVDGRQLAGAARPNGPVAQPGGEGWFHWDAAALRQGCEEVLAEVTAALGEAAQAVRSVAVAGFGADGAPVTLDGELRYPIISWHDARARASLDRLVERLGAETLYATTGYHPYPINTLARWAWLGDHAPHSLERSTWLMVPHLAAFWLCGEMGTDPTSASTTMAFDLRTGAWADELLAAAGVSAELPGRWVEPGEAVGQVREDITRRTGLPPGTIVGAGGHDCEIGTLAASGRLPEDTFIDITGTWEMLIVPTHQFAPSEALFARGIDWERHVIPGTYLCQSLMPAGSVLTWLRDLAYPDSRGSWTNVIAEAERGEPGAGGVTLVPAFVPGMGPFGLSGETGSLRGLRTTTTRAQLARAAYEALCYQLRGQLEVLEDETGRSCSTVRVLGGGQRSDFWLQLKADVTGRVVEAVQTDELTALGAALLGGVAAGVFTDCTAAQGAISHRVRTFAPDAERQAVYDELYTRRDAEASR